MATGLYVLPDGSVMVAYGRRQIPVSCAQYKANGYKPALEKLTGPNSLTAQKSRVPPPRGSPADWTQGRLQLGHLRAPDLAGASSQAASDTRAGGPAIKKKCEKAFKLLNALPIK